MNKNSDKMKEIISILMESTLYFDIPLYERREIIVRLIERINWA
jgi:putative effector of murein hydrolase